ncbi:hypothetical protein H0H81_007579 [Sphagnurus paluster]|uniref:Uncharacterized protein n=1 Tax=Sphagnurus paluster TaxID=117069 RepID=A0A9P7K688_9AGAR|nr:hypothetical protein H0H81_007579 [Sphagnurus paluster]
MNIRTHSDLGPVVWSEINKFSGLRKISIWCMEGPPRVLQGWADSLGSTLTHLELGVSPASLAGVQRCAGVPPTILIAVLSQLPKLTALRLKGAPANAIPTIMGFLLNLRSLDTDYPGTYYSGRSESNDSLRPPPPFPALRELTVRTSSMDIFGPQKLWGWIRELVPKPGLETLKLHTFTINSGHTSIPPMFILDLALIHGQTLRHFMVGEAQLTLGDIECLCAKFPNLETLSCSSASPDIKSISQAISPAKNLRTLRLHVQWIPSGDSMNNVQFTAQDATELMRRSEYSKLRTIAIGPTLFTVRTKK